MSQLEYNYLLYEISGKLNSNQLAILLFMCREYIPKGAEDSIQNVLKLFKVLEEQSRLGIDNLETLKEILTILKKTSLLKKVKEFEVKRKAKSAGIISSLKRATGRLIGAIRMVCNFRTLAGGVILVGSGLALRSCCSFEEYCDAFNKVVLPAFTKLVELSESSLCFTVLAETPSALKELWNIYDNETLKNRLQTFLVTEEVKQLASGEEIEVTVSIDEQEYREAYLDLTFRQNRASDKKGQEGGRLRRNSDSFLFLSQMRDEVTLMQLHQAENKWNFKMQILENEIDKLKMEIALSEENAPGVLQAKIHHQKTVEPGNTKSDASDIPKDGPVTEKQPVAKTHAHSASGFSGDQCPVDEDSKTEDAARLSEESPPVCHTPSVSGFTSEDKTATKPPQEPATFAPKFAKDENSMASLTGILLDVSASMASSIGEGIGEEGGPWALSIFEVIDNLIKYDISSDNHVFAIGFGASYGEGVFDIIGTLKQIPNQDNVAEGPATTEHINQIFDVLERAGARTVRKWAEVEVVKKALTDNLANVFLNKFKSDQTFLKEFAENILPPACRDWPEPEVDLYLGPAAAAAASVILPSLVIPSVLALKYGKEAGKHVYSSVVARYRRATVEEVMEVVEKAKAYLLKKVDADSIYNVQDALAVVHGCVDEKNLTKERSRELLQRIEPYIYGTTPFFRSIREAMALFQDSKFSSHKKLLFNLSDGEPTDGDIFSGIDRVISKFTDPDVTVVSCFITDSTHIDPKRLFSKEEPDWDRSAKFMFSLSSKLSTQSLPRTMFVKRDWTIDIADNETHLFLQVNHPDHLREGCEVARNIVCCQDALSDLLAFVNLDVYINQELKGHVEKTKQEGETCYANASATVLHLSMKRVCGREGGCPDFYTLREEIVKQFENDENYSDDVPTFRVLQKMCPKYRLHCQQVDVRGAIAAITSGRPVVATFRLTDNEWDTFEEFYENNPKGILTKKEIDITARPRDTLTSGHAVVLTSFDSECLRLLNSWGEDWADMGFFRVQRANVLGLEFIDVYWTEDDLKEEEIIYFKKHGSTLARQLMETLPSLKRAEYMCPKCSKRSPVMEFTGTLSRAKCPKCGQEISTENTQEGNILALNIYLTSLIT